ncbi:MAG: hypothetical protein DHS20C18_23800 [Saprospiraceae bacterium]|nr:MAG: hypothetical protein DHS20C18_23800 [Saprospiraceae bacterium]
MTYKDLLSVLKLSLVLVISTGHVFGQKVTFTDVTEQAGLNYEHSLGELAVPVEYRVSGGFALGDYNNDGFIDLFLERGDTSLNLLFQNLGNGQFRECTAESGLILDNYSGCGPLFLDYNGDAYLDLIIGSIDESGALRLFENTGDGKFKETTDECGISLEANTYSISAGDFNRDGNLDLFLSHWQAVNRDNHIWKNTGNHSFVNVDEDLNFYNPFGSIDYTFTGNFTDINNDNFQDLVITSDFGTSQIWINQEGNRYVHITDAAITDENGMGSAIGDYNNDGFLDWFVSSIYDDDGITEGNWGTTGNRLYKNLGDNHFEDVTEVANVRNGGWGWGASFADFNNDGHLDIMQTNGWPQGSDQFYFDPTRLYISNGDDTFTESANTSSLIDTSQGRGLACFDFDRDGDLDVFISNYRGFPKLWRNDSKNENNYITLKLQNKQRNKFGVGAKIHLYTGSKVQMREIRCGNNYVSQNPLEAHFGLGLSNIIDSIVVTWPNGSDQRLFNVGVNQFLTISNITPENNLLQSAIQIIPNPFIQYVDLLIPTENLAAPELDIYTVQGIHVKNIKTYSVLDGMTYFSWNGTNQQGVQMPGGAYVAKFSSMGSSQSESAIIIKSR